MRITINNCRCYILVADWFAEKYNINKHETAIIKQTDLAIFLDFGNDVQQWIPKTLITVHKIPKGLEDWQ